MTAEVRLVDADELRRRLKDYESDEGTGDPWATGRLHGLRIALGELSDMPTVTAPKVWTRDEVLAALAEHPDNVCEWLNPYSGRWVQYPNIDVRTWDPEVRRFDVRVVRSTPDPEWVPLTKLVGRTIKGETKPVGRFLTAINDGCRWTSDGTRWHYFPDGTLNLDTACVEVLAEGERS